MAELAALELGGLLSLDEAVRLTALVALHDRARAERYALRWLVRYMAERSATARRLAIVGRLPARARRAGTPRRARRAQIRRREGLGIAAIRRRSLRRSQRRLFRHDRIRHPTESKYCPIDLRVRRHVEAVTSIRAQFSQDVVGRPDGRRPASKQQPVPFFVIPRAVGLSDEERLHVMQRAVERPATLTEKVTPV